MFTSHVVSQATSPATIRRGSRLYSLIAAITAGLVVLVLALVIGVISGGSTHRHAANPLPQVRDLSPAWNLGEPPVAASTSAAAFRDPQTHALLNVRP